MSETGAVGPAYRLIAYVGARANVRNNRNFGSLTLAHQEITRAIRTDRSRCIDAIEVQRGLPSGAPCVDPFAVVPGLRGGWSHLAWETVERFDEAALRALRGAARSALPTTAHRSQRVIMVAGLLAILVSTSALFGLQSGGPTAGTVAVANAQVLTQLPITRERLEESAERAEPNEASLERTLRSAFGGPLAADGGAGHDQRDSW